MILESSAILSLSLSLFSKKLSSDVSLLLILAKISFVSLQKQWDKLVQERVMDKSNK